MNVTVLIAQALGLRGDPWKGMYCLAARYIDVVLLQQKSALDAFEAKYVAWSFSF